ncbi:MAG: prenyltransferase [Dehalococcoidia bacterium]|nr:prenyltransferase [Dehalococcoidia bacterium]
MANVKILFAETRPQFLLLTPVCVFAGIAASLYDGNAFHGMSFVLAFIGALFAHITVNVLNDYFDYQSGVDLKTERTPFSGGSGMLPEGMLKPSDVLLLGLGSLAVVILIGIYFIAQYGWAMLPIGLVGVLLISLYTPIFTRIPAASEVAAGGFGLLVLGTYFTQEGTYSAAAVVSTVVTGLLIANLLLLNEFPDAEADKVGGRKHLPITLGPSVAAKIYCGIVLLSYAVIIGGVIAEILPTPALLGLLTLPLGMKAMRGAIKNYKKIGELVPSLGMNVLVVLLTPFLMSVGVVIGAAID